MRKFCAHHQRTRMAEIEYILNLRCWAGPGPTAVTSELMCHFRPVFASMIPLAMRAHASIRIKGFSAHFDLQKLEFFITWAS